MNNPYGADPRLALYPLPRNSAGGRLYAVLRERRPDVGLWSYVNTLERYNLVAGAWSAARAREGWAALHPRLGGRTVLLLGQDVRAVVGVPRELVLPTVLDGVTYRQLPHPSGRCRWYNDPEQRAVAALLMEELYEEGLRALAEET